MIGRLESVYRKVQQISSLSEWAARLLRLPESVDTATEPGLVMIQVDGLSLHQLQRALQNKAMPFLAGLLIHERYDLHSLYSGLPSSTPAVQGEIFYGVKGAVPAFGFVNPKTGHVVKMFQPDTVTDIEARLKDGRPGLLDGGSAYSDIFVGGARESHFCMANLGWGEWKEPSHPLAMPLLVLANAFTLVRLVFHFFLELLYAVGDFLRSVWAGQDVIKEMRYIFTRLGVCVLLRDLSTAGVKIDVARGLPVIHLNLVGYDEQSHRRGPSSRYAHWTLTGIDRAIGQIWRAAQRSSRRAYDVWVYSDHGQEDPIPYQAKYGRTLPEAVQSLFNGKVFPHRWKRRYRRFHPYRLHLPGMSALGKLIPPTPPMEDELADSHYAVTSMGPLGYVYLLGELSCEKKHHWARELVKTARIPLVFVADEPGTAWAFTEDGEYHLPSDFRRLFGANHPFLEEMGQDLLDLCHHPAAGVFVISGWRKNQRPIGLAVENGCHGGPGTEETGAFALLPVDAPLPARNRLYLRPADIHRAALRFLKRTPEEPFAEAPVSPKKFHTLRLMTYNVHSCLGMDGKYFPERIARVIARHAVDVVALQELDVGRPRSGHVDQAHIIAQELKMLFHFLPAMRMEEEQYGDAIFSRTPMMLVRAEPLPGLPPGLFLEPRGALWVSIALDPALSVQVINTHLSLSRRERSIQVDELLGPRWLAHPDCRAPAVLCGDFNALPGSLVERKLSRCLKDAQREMESHRPLNTWFGRYPLGRIDHVYVLPGVEVLNIEVPNTELDKVASDHLPLIVELRLP
ncbi:MAG: endonuclease/exonuclease/phosphatase family protein [Elusimicrobia bacterium]|nr:endonuclease/exonuclease/phosphatase family protein [Elusimicrobiota bacterium]